MRLRPKLRPGLPQTTTTNQSHRRRSKRCNPPDSQRLPMRLSNDSVVALAFFLSAVPTGCRPERSEGSAVAFAFLVCHSREGICFSDQVKAYFSLHAQAPVTNSILVPVGPDATYCCAAGMLHKVCSRNLNKIY